MIKRPICCFFSYRMSSTISTTTGTTRTTIPTTTTTQAATTLGTTLSSTTLVETTTPSSNTNPGPQKFPYPIVIIIAIWVCLAAIYFVLRWRQRAKVQYIIPRVFVLCSPRTVQYHYELILRVGLISYDFNPEKHDVDITILGQHHNNEVVPMTRLNTRTLLDEPLITSLSIVVYRLVEMPSLGGLLLKHSGPFKSWLFAYDFTIIDLASNREQYYPLNQYIGSLDRILKLGEPTSFNNVQYPIDDVPLPKWQLEDVILFIYIVINSIFLSITMMPINCNYSFDILSIFITTLGGGALIIFLDWLFYYNLAWNLERKDYFNDYVQSASIFKCLLLINDNVIKILFAIVGSLIGAAAIYFSIGINDWKESLVWSLSVVNTCTILVGLWNACRQVELAESIVGFGLRMRGVETVGIRMNYTDMVTSTLHPTKSGSTSDDGSFNQSSSKLPHISIGPRSSVKSFGFDPATGHLNHKVISRFAHSRLSSTGATPNNHPSLKIIRSTISPKSRHGHLISRLHNHSSEQILKPEKPSASTAAASNVVSSVGPSHATSVAQATPQTGKSANHALKQINQAVSPGSPQQSSRSHSDSDGSRKKPK